MNPVSLYDQAPATWDNIAASGRPSVRDMAKHFTRCIDMDRAFGFNNAASHWLSGRNMPSNATERLASAWLRAPRVTEPEAKPEPKHETAALLLVVCPLDAKAKAKRVLAMLGCEVLED